MVGCRAWWWSLIRAIVTFELRNGQPNTEHFAGEVSVGGRTTVVRAPVADTSDGDGRRRAGLGQAHRGPSAPSRPNGPPRLPSVPTTRRLFREVPLSGIVTMMGHRTIRPGAPRRYNPSEGAKVGRACDRRSSSSIGLNRTGVYVRFSAVAMGFRLHRSRIPVV